MNVGLCPGILLTDPMHCDRAGFTEAVAATAEVGFDSVSLWAMHAQAVGLGQTQSLLADAGLSVAVVEALVQWGSGPGPALREEAEATLDIASRFGAGMVGACVLEPALDVAAMTAGFAEICDLAASAGQRVCLEFLPWSAVPDLATGWRIVEAAGRDNGGILLDLWHWQREPGGPALELLRTIPGDRIQYVQLCDAAPEPSPPAPDLFAQAMSVRALPGDGVVDIGAVFDALAAIGAEPYVAAEVFNADLAAQGPHKMARAVRDASLRVL